MCVQISLVIVVFTLFNSATNFDQLGINSLLTITKQTAKLKLKKCLFLWVLKKSKNTSRDYSFFVYLNDLSQMIFSKRLNNSRWRPLQFLSSFIRPSSEVLRLEFLRILFRIQKTSTKLNIKPLVSEDFKR